jgi:3-deoxy-7-phosphoheptulonate synthase/chorismate mutase
MELRKKISEINYDMLNLLNERASLINEIVKIKDEIGTDYYDPKREGEMLKELTMRNKGPLPDELVNEIFSDIFQTTLKYMRIKKEGNLLVESGDNKKFKTIHEMFNLDTRKPIVIAGPCAVENIEYLDEAAQVLSKNNIKFIRGGALIP